MEDALAYLSRNLPEAFEETITRIQRFPESWRRLGINILMWICHVKRAMTVYEPSDTSSVKLGQAAMSPKHCPPPKMMVECCQGLVAIDTEAMSIRLAHYPIQEYLVEHSNKLFLRAEANIAVICLTYLFSTHISKVRALRKMQLSLTLNITLSSRTPQATWACTYKGQKQIKTSSTSLLRSLALMVQ
jgi:hypothetical protein